MSIFTNEPHLQVQQQRRKRKAPSKYVEQKKYRPKQIEERLYQDRPDHVKDSIKKAVMNHTAALKFRATPSHRRQHNRKKREYLRQRYRRLGLFKYCNTCSTTRPQSDFDFQKDGRHQRRSYCMFCRKEKNKIAYQRRKEAHDTN